MSASNPDLPYSFTDWIIFYYGLSYVVIEFEQGIFGCVILCHQKARLDEGVSVSLKQTNTKTNTFHPNTCVSLVLVGTNTPEKLTPPRGGNWC
jgi:hypothetical protein